MLILLYDLLIIILSFNLKFLFKDMGFTFGTAAPTAVPATTTSLFGVKTTASTTPSLFGR